MVGDPRSDRGQIDHLANHLADDRRVGEVRAASPATSRLMLDDLVGCPTFEMGAGSTGLLALRAFRGPGISAAFRPLLADLDRVGRGRLG